MIIAFCNNVDTTCHHTTINLSSNQPLQASMLVVAISITNANQFQASSGNPRVRDNPYVQMTMKKKQGKCSSLTTISANVERMSE